MCGQLNHNNTAGTAIYKKSKSNESDDKGNRKKTNHFIEQNQYKDIALQKLNELFDFQHCLKNLGMISVDSGTVGSSSSSSSLNYNGSTNTNNHSVCLCPSNSSSTNNDNNIKHRTIILRSSKKKCINDNKSNPANTDQNYTYKNNRHFNTDKRVYKKRLSNVLTNNTDITANTITITNSSSTAINNTWKAPVNTKVIHLPFSSNIKCATQNNAATSNNYNTRSLIDSYEKLLLLHDLNSGEIYDY
ncbi:uncharacterized protein SCDLUD_000533 [Saccharomycodes ludwigii]|uniref:uncharacterized protein n=1 Tax=Saccharomycodes ludwigii TaxID=36035 RepID=UPI001E8B9CB1|nr:hypothetical protein SCDLUD_000533 [Saccharomycodes ludwigii]KAH3902934.1 hypothetical protein SCDLUD_000533 [Saccharomycodes ludwigii]